MKKLYIFLAVILMTSGTFAQAPEKMSYQAIIRDSGDALVTNQTVGMQISILQSSATGTVVYVETQTTTTNVNGLVTLEIGTGTTSDVFSVIDWTAGPYFIKTETDPTGGSSYTITGTSQLLSVPYALHAKTGGNGLVSGGIESQVLTIVNGVPVWATPPQCTSIFYIDADGDEYGDLNISVVACSAPLGFVLNSTDCDDSNPNINPGTFEVWADGVDNNCNGSVDEYPSQGYPTSCGIGVCYSTGIIIFQDGNYIDTCNTNVPTGPEICDGIDNDCDGLVDEGFENTFYADIDGDSFGDINNKIIVSCSSPQPAGYVIYNTDCDDNNPAVYPNAVEIADGIDNDCDGQIDEL